MKGQWERIADQWTLFSSKAQKEWSGLTDSELEQVDGSLHVLASLIHSRYFISKKAAYEQIEAWVAAQEI